MNIYDFDDTIYDGDTGADIVKYSIVRHPILTLKSLIKVSTLLKDYKAGVIEYDVVKEQLFSFIFKIKDYNAYINEFVESHMNNIKPWYKQRQTDNDVLATASYDLWINLFAKNLGIKYVVCTKVDENGKIIGRNCKGEEKVKRLNELFPNARYDYAYSDSEVDIPILELASKAYVVEGDILKPYVKGYKFKNNR